MIKYSVESFDVAVAVICPELRDVINHNIRISRPEQIKMVALEVFMWPPEKAKTLTFSETTALNTIKATQKDLLVFGHFLFTGEVKTPSARMSAPTSSKSPSTASSSSSMLGDVVGFFFQD